MSGMPSSDLGLRRGLRGVPVNGVGWVCDECGKTEVVQGDYFVQQGPGQPPAGWYLLFKAQPERAAENERWEFCSVRCIHKQSAEPTAGNCHWCAMPTVECGELWKVGGGSNRCCPNCDHTAPVAS